MEHIEATPDSLGAGGKSIETLGNSLLASKREVKHSRVLSAANAVARFQITQLVNTVIATLQDMDASGLFSEIQARHAWDEYCWQLQEGPFDEDDIGFGSTSGNFQAVLETLIDAGFEVISAPTLQLLMAYICEEELFCDEGKVCDCTLSQVKEFVARQVGQIASRRSLALIGPDRAELITYDHSLDGLVGDAFREADEYFDLLSQNADVLLSKDPLAHKQVAIALLERYMELLHVAAGDSEALVEMLTRFDSEIRAMVLEKDLWPNVENLVGQLQETLDE